ncbi:hypothetical protein QE197_00185 [Arsenophonus nasoniae]|uniref:Uncharacterized protein n=1 Tax=Arsenophonus nasoniae TaxID=638 RepID=A0ABY8NP85_9GAMM|nr:hypothetical protein [Arsenophonus nasoniae]WGM05857.1 hypothetical protein QE258_00180 [Arsenophonus nasoniae]WGM10872.1 hypothetical protein QE197_00185 [Arsenophonus nasoniae]
MSEQSGIRNSRRPARSQRSVQKVREHGEHCPTKNCCTRSHNLSERQ